MKLTLKERYEHYAQRIRDLWDKRHSNNPFEGAVKDLIKYDIRRMKEYRARMRKGKK